jgi:hypothetical protein
MKASVGIRRSRTKGIAVLMAARHLYPLQAQFVSGSVSPLVDREVIICDGNKTPTCLI